MKLVSKLEYERMTAETRDERIKWWREARFGLFIHYGLYSLVGRNEWVMAIENSSVEEYEKLADQFNPKPGAPRTWVELAKKAGMKYIVFTTRHHEGFSLWDSSVNPYNSVNHGPKRDIVREYVDACREYDMKIGFYSSLMDWHHPDSWRCAYDSQARSRFTEYTMALNRELLTNYGKIDILWYDSPWPMESCDGWNTLELNTMARTLQPDIIINNRCRLDEDFGTPEERLKVSESDWEACMTFNGISWGYVDSPQAVPYSYNAQRIIQMLHTATSGSGNLLLNIGPMPDGSIPAEVVEPLETVGRWLSENGQAVYGKKVKSYFQKANGLCGASFDGLNVYLWNWIWPSEGELIVGGFFTKVKSITLVKDGSAVDFIQSGQRIIISNLPKQPPDQTAGITVLKFEFSEVPEFHRASYYPQLNRGVDYSNKIIIGN